MQIKGRNSYKYTKNSPSRHNNAKNMNRYFGSTYQCGGGIIRIR